MRMGFLSRLDIGKVLRRVLGYCGRCVHLQRHLKDVNDAGVRYGKAAV